MRSLTYSYQGLAMNKSTLFLTIILAVFGSSLFAESLELSLDKAIEMALENNISMQNAREDLLKAKAP